MAATGGEPVRDEAFVTLATNDSYALGALVLSQSLRGVGASRQIVAMITDGVSKTMRGQLLYAFDALIEVDLLDSKDVVNLKLLSRTDLGLTFTKLHCWRLTQYKKCVFLDADTLVLKNIDELFECEELAASPDIGWPDCFNSGVFVYRPSQTTYESLLSFALTHGSFDGGDQGLLNLYFNDWSVQDSKRRLPFLYNVVATAFYSYPPAYKQFGSAIKVVHFIGAVKPWHAAFNIATRSVEGAEGHASEFLNLWWTLFIDRVHHRLDDKLKEALLKPKEGAGEHSPHHHDQPTKEEMSNLRVLNKELLDDGQRQYNWEKGQIDYMGVDSFENILKQLEHKILEPQPEEDRSRPGNARDKSRSKGRASPRARSTDKTPSPTEEEASKSKKLGAPGDHGIKHEEPLVKAHAPQSSEIPFSVIPKESHHYVYPKDGDKPLYIDFVSWTAPVKSLHQLTLFVTPTLYRSNSRPASAQGGGGAHPEHAAGSSAASRDSIPASKIAPASDHLSQASEERSAAAAIGKTPGREGKHQGHDPHLSGTASSSEYGFSTTVTDRDPFKGVGIQSTSLSGKADKTSSALGAGVVPSFAASSKSTTDTAQSAGLGLGSTHSAGLGLSSTQPAGLGLSSTHSAGLGLSSTQPAGLRLSSTHSAGLGLSSTHSAGLGLSSSGLSSAGGKIGAGTTHSYETTKSKTVGQAFDTTSAHSEASHGDKVAGQEFSLHAAPGIGSSISTSASLEPTLSTASGLGSSISAHHESAFAAPVPHDLPTEKAATKSSDGAGAASKSTTTKKSKKSKK